jgi:hypothetical protein
MYLSWACKSGQWLHLFAWRKIVKKNEMKKNNVKFVVNVVTNNWNEQCESRMYLSWACKSGQWLHLFVWRKIVKKNWKKQMNEQV